jgi:hypothetical protein
VQESDIYIFVSNFHIFSIYLTKKPCAWYPQYSDSFIPIFNFLTYLTSRLLVLMINELLKINFLVLYIYILFFKK